MSEKLFESSFIKINTSIWAANRSNRPVQNQAQNQNNPETGNANKNPSKGDYIEWGNYLKKRIEANEQRSQDDRLSRIEIIKEFFKDFFITNWGQDVGAKLNSFNNIQKYFIRKDTVYLAAFDPNTSPLLKYLTKEFVIELIKEGKLNSGTFNTILIAYQDNIVKSSEFAKQVSKDIDKNEYNILYCTDLYEKSPSIMLDYLKLQKSALADGINIVKNKLTFLKTGTIDAFDPEERAEKINAEINKNALPKDLNISIKDCALNSLDLIKLILNTNSTPTTSLSSSGQNAIVEKLDTISKIFAAIFTLSLTTDSTEAKEALKNSMFTGIPLEKKFNAAVWLAGSNILPKGQLNKTDADALVTKLINKMTSK